MWNIFSLINLFENSLFTHTEFVVVVVVVAFVQLTSDKQAGNVEWVKGPHPQSITVKY